MLAYHQVSIHAPREGCDSALKTNDYDTRSFNSRTPGGVRHLLPHLIHNQDMFQFTHPGRGATDELHGEFRAGKVSIHAPREGCDVWDLI